jgi:hypothetical protein
MVRSAAGPSEQIFDAPLQRLIEGGQGERRVRPDN